MLWLLVHLYALQRSLRSLFLLVQYSYYEFLAITTKKLSRGRANG